MKIADTLTEAMILPNLTAANKIDCLMEFAEAAHHIIPDLKQDETAHILLEREKLGSTGIQDGIAIPHGKLKELQQILILFGRSLKGIDFQSFDNRPTQLFFVLLAPDNATSEHLKLLARLSKLLKRNELRDRLLKAQDAKEIYQILCREDEKI